MEILKPGFEDDVRVRLGVNERVLPDSAINNRSLVRMAEMRVKERVPNYSEITDPDKLEILELAAIAYLCHKLAPSMAFRVKVEVATIDTKWKLGKINWEEVAQSFLEEFEELLSVGGDSTLMGIAKYEGVRIFD